MVAALVLVVGLLVVLVAGSLMLAFMGYPQLLPALVPLAPGLICVGAILLALVDVLLLFGNREDRSTVKKDYTYLLPIILVSGTLYYVTQRYLW